MGLSDRQIRRLASRFKGNGPESIIHGLRGKPSNRRLSQTLKDEAVALVKEIYSDFGPAFATEMLVENHDIQIGHEVLRQLMIHENIWRFKQRNVTHRNRREPKSCYGEMEQFDGCRLDWFEGRGPKATLLASRDDAGNRVRASFAEYEGTNPVMAFWKEYMLRHGKPPYVYRARHSTYKVNAKSALDDPEIVSQFERAMDELGVEVIHASSPQGKSRIENLFGTLQDRLVKELRLAGISTIAGTNRFLEKTFLPAYNNRFCVPTGSAANAHWPVSPKEDLDQILSVQSQRLVNRDFTIRFKAQCLQLAKTQGLSISMCKL